MDAAKETEAEIAVGPILMVPSCHIGVAELKRQALDHQLVRKSDLVILPIMYVVPYPTYVDISIPIYSYLETLVRCPYEISPRY